MFFKNSINFINNFLFIFSKQIRQFYLNSSIYNKKISKFESNTLNYKPNLIVFSYTSFAENHKTFTTGTYTFHRKFITPATIYNINDFIEFFSKNNYLLKHKSIMQKIDLSFQDSLGVKTRVYNLVFQNSQ